MITILYRLIVLLLLIFTLIILYKEEKLTTKLNAAIVLIPLILRVLMIK